MRYEFATNMSTRFDHTASHTADQNFETTILFGGTSRERLVSVASAQHLAAVFPEAELWFWTEHDSFVQVRREELLAHLGPFEHAFVPSTKPFANALEAMLERALRERRLLLLGLHGARAEDGELPRACEAKGIPFTGSGSLASEIAFHKPRAKEVVAAAGVRVAPALLLQNAHDGLDPRLHEWLQQHGKLVAKPAADGSSYGLHIIETDYDLERLPVLAGREPYLVEPFLRGPEASVGVVEWDGVPEVLPPVEIRINADRVFDYAGKYLGSGTSEVCPAELPADVITALQAAALIAFKAVGAFGYARSDFIVTEEGPTFLEINTLPGLTQSSLIPLELRAAKRPFGQFMQAQIAAATKRLRG
ncbi:MAG: D-alanine--D-alanine ligase [Myxococcaceae bacterium]|nr:D-alanine--D-alanine ligase [Myxococcaceae bacterium]